MIGVPKFALLFVVDLDELPIALFHLFFRGKRRKIDGAATKSRTRDLLITNQLLYQLSYSGT
jgi:hypothetical protein